MNKAFKKTLKTLGYGLLAVFVALFLFSPKNASADITSNYWIQNSPGSLATNAPGGLATADIHVAHCYIGLGTSTSCASGGGGASLSGNNVFTGQNTFTNANQTNIANLDTTLYADQFSGSDICAQNNAAYAAAPSLGANIIDPAGAFTCTNSMSFSTNGKKVNLIGSGAGTQITYTGTGNFVTINNGGTFAQYSYYALRNLTLIGNDNSSTSTQVGVFLGGSNGAAGVIIDNVNLDHFGKDLATGQNAYDITYENSTIRNAYQNVYIAPANNSGESMRLLNMFIVDPANGRPTDCIVLDSSSVASFLWNGGSSDDCQIHFKNSNFNAMLVGIHEENPQSSVYGVYDYMVADSSSNSNIILNGGTFYNGASVNTPVEFISDGTKMTLQGVTFASNSVVTPVAQAVTLTNTNAQLTWEGIENTSGNAITNLVTNSIGSIPVKTRGYTDYAGDQNNINTNGSIIATNKSNFGSTSTGTAWVTIAGGTASPDVAPLKITPGTLTATAQSGAIENDGNHLYYVNSVPTRIQLDGQGTSLLASNNIWTGTNAILSTSATAFSVGANGATNPVFAVNASQSSQVDGIVVKGLGSGNGTTITATSSGANSPVTLTSIGTGVAALNASVSATDQFQIAGSSKFSISSTGANGVGMFLMTDQASSASTPRFEFIGALDTGLIGESTSVLLNIGNSRQWASNTSFALQRFSRVQQPTATFASATGTITEADTFEIDGAPIAGTNAVITNSYALKINAGNSLFNGNISLGVAGNKLNIATGSNASIGTGTLASGTATISTTAVTSSSEIFLTDTSGNALTNVGSLTVGTITAGTNFVVKSTNVLDTSTFNWLIIN